MKKHLNLIISGKVQHIGFRFSAMQAAYKYGITGYARNKRTGSVYIEAEGEEENLNNFLSWCKVGPVGAEIADIEATEADIKEFKSFDIKY